MSVAYKTVATDRLPEQGKLHHVGSLRSAITKDKIKSSLQVSTGSSQCLASDVLIRDPHFPKLLQLGLKTVHVVLVTKRTVRGILVTDRGDIYTVETQMKDRPSFKSNFS